MGIEREVKRHLRKGQILSAWEKAKDYAQTRRSYFHEERLKTILINSYRANPEAWETVGLNLNPRLVTWLARFGWTLALGIGLGSILIGTVELVGTPLTLGMSTAPGLVAAGEGAISTCVAIDHLVSRVRLVDLFVKAS